MTVEDIENALGYAVEVVDWQGKTKGSGGDTDR